MPEVLFVLLLNAINDALPIFGTLGRTCMMRCISQNGGTGMLRIFVHGLGVEALQPWRQIYGTPRSPLSTKPLRNNAVLAELGMCELKSFGSFQRQRRDHRRQTARFEVERRESGLL